MRSSASFSPLANTKSLIVKSPSAGPAVAVLVELHAQASASATPSSLAIADLHVLDQRLQRRLRAVGRGALDDRVALALVALRARLPDLRRPHLDQRLAARLHRALDALDRRDPLARA